MRSWIAWQWMGRVRQNMARRMHVALGLAGNCPAAVGRANKATCVGAQSCPRRRPRKRLRPQRLRHPHPQMCRRPHPQKRLHPRPQKRP